MDPESFSKTSSILGFAHNRLDRLANRRDDAVFIESLRQSSSARTALVLGDTVLLQGEPGALTPWFGFVEAARLGSLGETAFLGRDGTGPVFAALLDGPTAEDLAERPGISLYNLRALAVDNVVSGEDLGALAEGKALLHWHAHHRFCPNCGVPSKVSGAGWRRECPSCGTHHFPRTDPVVIMLAVDGERCLLGRQPRFPPGMYSCLAGFVEPGETIEAAVGRELDEEAGISVGRVTYLGSQPWPFPASLMIGCLAEAISTEIAVDHDELEDARWFFRDEVLAMLAGNHPGRLACPTPMAIAHHIVRAWAEAPSAPIPGSTTSSGLKSHDQE